MEQCALAKEDFMALGDSNDKLHADGRAKNSVPGEEGNVPTNSSMPLNADATMEEKGEMGDEEDERECRVCREGAEDDHPLYAPCLCNGSILYCHQDCLEGWLKHSGKNKCELCGTLYSFSPKYAPDMPEIIPIHKIVSGSISAFCNRIAPFIFRVMMALTCWLFLVPYATSVLYTWLMSSELNMSYSYFDGAVTGVLLTGMIALVFIVMMSFADFLRAYWVRRDAQRPLNDPPAHIIPPVAPPLRPLDGRNVGHQGGLRDVPRPAHQPPGPREIPGDAAVRAALDNILDQADNGGRVVGAEGGAPARHPGRRGILDYPDIREDVEQLDQLLRDRGLHNVAEQLDLPVQHRGVRIEDLDAEGVAGLNDRLVALHEHERGGGWDRRGTVEELEAQLARERRLAEPAPPPLLPVEDRERANGAAADGDVVDGNNSDNESDASGDTDYDVPIGEEAQGIVNEAEDDDDDDLFFDGLDGFADDDFEVNQDIPAEPGVAVGAGAGGAANEGMGNNRRNRRRGGEANVEVHLNLTEILGLRGPLFTVCKYSLWVFAFNFCCMFVGLVVPAMMGSLATHMSRPLRNHAWISDGLSFFMTHVPPQVIEWATLVLRPSDMSKLIRLDELLEVGVGLFCIGILIILANVGVSVSIHCTGVSPDHARGVHGFSWALIQAVIYALGEVLKIGSMLGFRIFCLPCIIGSVVMLFLNMLLQCPYEVAATWAGNHIVGAVAVLWGSGIGFMLFTTITILQLREILHPDFLAKYIRPQESQSDLLSSLLNDPVFTQVRRLFASFGVYFSIAVVFIFLPIQLVTFLLPWIRPTAVYFWYIAPDLQVPFEVGLLHTVYLMVLEREKDKIGHGLYHLLLTLSRKFGVSRWLLPFTMKVIHCSPQREKGIKRKLEFILLENGKEAMITQPMLRPPKGWDARTRKSVTRWAWSPEEMEELEKSVAPRAKLESFQILRVVAMAIIVWLIIVSFTSALVLTPLQLGRTLLYVCAVPRSYWHDPFCLLLGIMAVPAALKLVRVGCMWYRLLKPHVGLFERRSVLLCAYIFSCAMFIIPFSVGLFYSVLVNYPSAALEPYLAQHFTNELVRTYFFGFAVVMWISTLILSGAIDRIFTTLGYIPIFSDVRTSVLVVVDSISQSANALKQGARVGNNRILTQDSLYTSLRAIEILAISPVMRYLGRFLTVSAFCVAVESIIFRTPSVVTCSPSFFHSFTQHLYWTHVLIYACTVLLLKQLLGVPLVMWCKWYYKSIKDENYLIGMELQNSEQGARHLSKIESRG